VPAGDAGRIVRRDYRPLNAAARPREPAITALPPRGSHSP
jgi:hypothetical protein